MKTLLGTLVLVLLAGPLAVGGQEASGPEAAAVRPGGRPVPDGDGNYRVGNGVVAPKVVSQRDVEYSEEARRKKLSGSCTVGLTVGVGGDAQKVHIVRSASEGVKPELVKAALSMDEKAVAAVKLYRFEPAKFEGRAVPVAISVEISFRIR